jgi:hypothetical protein
MKPLQLSIMSGGKAVETLPVAPRQFLRLIAFAKTNKRSLIGMIDLAIQYATAPDDKGPRLQCPEEEKILAIAANLLTDTQVDKLYAVHARRAKSLNQPTK